MRVAFRTDASTQIGTGHLRRCLSLARALKDEGAETLFLCRRHDAVSELVAQEGLPHAWLPAPSGSYQPEPDVPPHASWAGTSWQDDAAETARALARFAPDWVLVDHYAFDARWQRAVAAALQARMAAIDDLADRDHAVDLLVDQNLHPDSAAKYAGRVAPPAHLLFGPRFAQLAHGYASAPRYRFRRRVASIGIFMGGADPGDFGGRVLQACREHAGFRGEIELVSSTRSQHFAGHQALARRWPDTRVLTDLPDLAGFFARHDLQIGSGGGAAWERCCLGAPTLAIEIAANQRAVLPHLAALGAVEWLAAGATSRESMGRAIRRLIDEPRRRLRLVRASRGLVDGRGSARVAAVMALAHAPGLRFRTAQAADEALLLAWANDPQVRALAFNSATILPANHKSWFRARLAQCDACCIVIATSAAGMPVGQVRFDREAGGWTIGYSLDAAFRGWGHGRRLLAGAVEYFRERFGAADITGLVKAENAASLRVFRALGFEESTLSHHDSLCHRFVLKLPKPDSA